MGCHIYIFAKYKLTQGIFIWADHLSGDSPTGSELVKLALEDGLDLLKENQPDSGNIVAERLPQVSFEGFYYLVSYTDPATGEIRQVAAAPADVAETFAQVAQYSAQAIVPDWEAATLAAKEAYLE